MKTDLLRHMKAPAITVALIALLSRPGILLTSVGNTAQATGAVIYVAADGSGATNGTSWPDAYTDLQTPLANATNGSEIWVARGTYKPTSGTDATVSFQLKNEVAHLRGFCWGVEPDQC